MARIIAHIDLNAFFATCEELKDPSLKEVPLIIGHSGRSGIVSTCNYKAREYGIHSGQPTFQAKKLCPGVRIVAPDYRYYQVMSTSFFEMIKQYCKKIEVASIDECFCDFTDVLKNVKNPVGYLRAMQSKIKDELGLPCSIGVAPTKWLAKMGSDLHKPMGLTIIRRKDIPNIIYPLPIESFWGIGKKTSPELRKLGIFTIKDLKIHLDAQDPELSKMLGKFESTIKEWINGNGDDQVITEYPDPKSIGNSHTLSFDSSCLEEIDDSLLALAKEVSSRAKEARKKGYGITLTVKDTSFHLHSKATRLEESSNEAKVIYEVAKELYLLHYEHKLTIRLVGITLTNLVDPIKENVQMSLWNYETYQDMDQTKLLIHELNRKLGEGTLMRSAELKKDKQ